MDEKSEKRQTALRMAMGELVLQWIDDQLRIAELIEAGDGLAASLDEAVKLTADQAVLIQDLLKANSDLLRETGSTPPDSASEPPQWKH